MEIFNEKTLKIINLIENTREKNYGLLVFNKGMSNISMHIKTPNILCNKKRFIIGDVEKGLIQPMCNSIELELDEIIEISIYNENEILEDFEIIIQLKTGYVYLENCIN